MSAPDRLEIVHACSDLCGRDPILKLAFNEIGVPIWRSTAADYETLARAVAYQLISTKAAAAIWGRTSAFFAGDVRAETILEADEDALRACGNSRPKVGHMRSIAQAVISGDLCFDRLRESELSVARKELLAVKGIGPWTADLFLMNALGHMDAFPIGDVGIMEAYRALSNAETRHQTKVFTQLAESWRPYRGVAAHLLWGWLNAMRDKVST